jgi:hypothetical protein
VAVVHGTEGKGFPWRSALDYQIDIPQPKTCYYYGGSETLVGDVPAIRSPAAFEGTPVALVLDIFLGKPTEDVDFDLSCTSLQGPPARGNARGTHKPEPSPGIPSPNKFRWIKPKRSPAHIFPARWRGDDNDQQDSYPQRPYPRYWNIHKLDLEKIMNSGLTGHHSDSDAPEQPPPTVWSGPVLRGGRCHD